MWFSHRFIRRVKSFPPLVNACHGSMLAFSVSLFVISSLSHCDASVSLLQRDDETT
jgi:hypothetical protein